MYEVVYDLSKTQRFDMVKVFDGSSFMEFEEGCYGHSRAHEKRNILVLVNSRIDRPNQGET